MSRDNKPIAVKVVGWRISEDLVERVRAIAKREGRYVERVASDALRAGLPAADEHNKPIE